jgi:hypothetical protein
MKGPEQPTYYQQRKATGVCAQTPCRAKAEPGRSKCQKHLRTMAAHAQKTRRNRKRDGLCVCCGKRPQFWGRKCIICRQNFTSDPLPKGARKALRLYRESEARRQLEESQYAARLAALKLIDTGEINGKRAEALRLYVGLDNGKWRTRKEISVRMKVSLERVRQLLLPAKARLASILNGKVPWGLHEAKRGNQVERKCQSSTSLRSTSFVAISDYQIADHQIDRAVPYQINEQNVVTLLGLVNSPRGSPSSPTLTIPHLPELHKTIARALLCKPSLLSGRELQFVRQVAGLTSEKLAIRLGVVKDTIVLWERARVMHYRNDLAARIVLGSLIFGDSFCVEVVKRFDSIKGALSPYEIRLRWHPDESYWKWMRDEDTGLTVNGDQSLRRPLAQFEARPTPI